MRSLYPLTPAGRKGAACPAHISLQAWELYDLQSDPNEQVNLSGRPEYAAEEARLRERLDVLRREVGDGDLPGYAPAEPRDLRFGGYGLASDQAPSCPAID
jgi:hypothetical protein